MARDSKTTTSTTINKYHFLFSFFILVTNLNQKQDQQFMHRFQYSGTAYTGSQSFLHSVGHEGGLSVARSVCDPVGESGWETVRPWDSRIERQLDRGGGPSVIPWPCGPCTHSGSVSLPGPGC